jgi:hypothetical protein
MSVSPGLTPACPPGCKYMRNIVVPVVMLAAASLAGAADLPSGESLLLRFIEASGGAAAYEKAKTVEMNGTIEIEGRNISGKISIVEAGEKSSTVMELPGIGRMEQGFDGETAWEMSALQGPRIIEGEEKSAMKHASTFALITSWREQYKSVQTVGTESVNGSPAWKVEMTPQEGRPETFYFDKQSALLVRMSATVASPLGDIPADMTVSDYRALDGIQTPFTMTQTAMGQSIAMHFDKIEYNAQIPGDQFEPPAGVKALLAKRKPQ